MSHTSFCTLRALSVIDSFQQVFVCLSAQKAKPTAEAHFQKLLDPTSRKHLEQRLKTENYHLLYEAISDGEE